MMERARQLISIKDDYITTDTRKRRVRNDIVIIISN